LIEEAEFPVTFVGRLDEAGLARFAARLARCVEVPMVLFLEGDLGAGKTTLCRALIQALGHAGRVKSPTYGLLERYELPALDVLHLDLYRIGDPGELAYLAIGDLFDERTLLLVEWPERGQGALPVADLIISLEYAHDERFVYLKPRTERGYAVCRASTNQASS
jgi:tRNA threonylcarbamoyladenosine biosynthesis protein TsaE